MKYSPFVMDHVRHPRNVGEIPDTPAKARVRSISDGDMLQLHLRISDNRITEAKFKVYGCGAAIATGSILTEILTGKTVDEALEVSNHQLSEMMGGLPPEKIHCSVLAEQAVREALATWKKSED